MRQLRRSVSAVLPDRVKRLVRRSGPAAREGYHRLLVRAVRSGLASEPRPTPLVVSLTTTPARLFGNADVAVATLLTQRLKPDRVVLWVSDEMAGHELPPRLRPLVAAGLEVRYGTDVGPHTKLLHALRAFPDSLIVTADDDMLYPRDWLSTLYASYRRAPGLIHCHRAHLMRLGSDGRLAPYHDWSLGAPGVVGPSHLLFQTGVGGVLFPPGSLAPEVFDVEAFRRLCPTNDDIWFKAMALLAGTRVRKVASESPRYRPITGSQESLLYETNLSANDPQLRATFDAYDLYPLLREEAGSAPAGAQPQDLAGTDLPPG